MSLNIRLQAFQDAVNQCDNLIASAHRTDNVGAFLFTEIDRSQITTAAFLNKFIAWETFLEEAFADFLIGEPTLSGAAITKFATPIDVDSAKRMIVGVSRYFDYANIDFVKKMSRIYFQNGHPFDTPIGAMMTDLSDLKTIRNACAHLTSTTQTALEAVAMRIFGSPRVGITPYVLVMSNDPRSTTGGTVYSEYKDKLLVAASLIAAG